MNLFTLARLKLEQKGIIEANTTQILDTMLYIRQFLDCNHGIRNRFLSIRKNGNKQEELRDKIYYSQIGKKNHNKKKIIKFHSLAGKIVERIKLHYLD